MEHPLISGLDTLKEEEITDKISELNKKLVIAARMGNGYVCTQIRMAIESYQNRYNYLQSEKAKQDSNGNSHFDKIDIS